MTGAVPLKQPAVTILLVLALRPLAVQAVAEAGTRYPHVDHLGSIVAISDVAGNVTTRNRYRPWGEALAIGDAAGTIRFTGKGRDEASGQYYFEARYLDASLGRFLSADPARQMRSPYAYAGDAPFVNVDPDGRVFTAEEGLLLSVAARGAAIDMSEGPGRIKRRVPDLIDVLKLRATRLGMGNLPLDHPWIHQYPRRLAAWSGSRGVSISYVMMDLYADLLDMRNELIPKYRAAVGRKREINKLEKELARLKAEEEAGRTYLRAVEEYGQKPFKEKRGTMRLIRNNENEILRISNELETARSKFVDPSPIHEKLGMANKMLNTIDDIVNYKLPRGPLPIRPAPEPPRLDQWIRPAPQPPRLGRPTRPAPKPPLE